MLAVVLVRGILDRVWRRFLSGLRTVDESRLETIRFADQERGSAGSVLGGFVLGSLLALSDQQFYKADMRGWA